jgi:hypothetical protein
MMTAQRAHKYDLTRSRYLRRYEPSADLTTADSKSHISKAAIVPIGFAKHYFCQALSTYLSEYAVNMLGE